MFEFGEVINIMIIIGLIIVGVFILAVCTTFVLIINGLFIKEIFIRFKILFTQGWKSMFDYIFNVHPLAGLYDILVIGVNLLALVVINKIIEVL